jgi:hypothetical protein
MVLVKAVVVNIVQPLVHKGHRWEAVNVSFLNSCPLFTG